jgi:hypothetical protein
MNKTLLGGSFLLATLVAACASDDGGIWFPPGGAGGKADGFSTIVGSDIPSQFASADKPYMITRQIASLEKVGAFDEVELRLVRRIDGILANMPTDGKLHLAELVRMEDAAIMDSLFADEVAALPRLWKKVEAPNTSKGLDGSELPFGVLDTATPPGPAVPPAHLAIATDLPEAQRAAATRLQNVFDDDNNPATVAVEDVTSGIANPGAFTRAEVTSFGATVALFREKSVAQSDATIHVSPAPGLSRRDATIGPVTLHLSGTTRIEELRQLNGSSTFRATLTAIQSRRATVELPAGQKLIVINKDDARESTADDGVFPGFRSVVIEVWQGTERVFSTNAVLPAITGELAEDLTSKLDYTFIGGLTPLVKNVASTTVDGNGSTARFTYDTTPVGPTGPVDQSVLRVLSTPVVTLPVGRYPVGVDGSTVLMVFPNNVVWGSTNGVMTRLMPSASSQGTLSRFRTEGSELTLDATTNRFDVRSTGLAVTLSASMREI